MKKPIVAANVWKEYTFFGIGGSTSFWALKDISFDIEQNTSVAIVGDNGSGKSTILKIIARVVAPTRGRVRVCGRIGSMLELGAGFHPELTGRENIKLSSIILGVPRRSVDKIYEPVIEFSELSEYIDMPIKYYSSGMMTRLAFSVSSHIDSDILLIDEVLSVGDYDFQKKCVDKINDIKRSGKTILFVSHDMETVKKLCDKAIYISGGEMLSFGYTEDVIKMYRGES
jgi:lipopolysaccharide transport system ATP-binding protein